MAMLYDDQNAPPDEDPYNFSQTQQATQSQSQSQEQEQDHWDEHLWGCLRPTHPGLRRYDLYKIRPSVTVGRARDCDINLKGMKISNRNCTITWIKETGMVKVFDESTNGTFVSSMVYSMLYHHSHAQYFFASDTWV